MPRMIYACVLALLAVIASTPAVAQDPPTAPEASPLTLDRAHALALEHNPELFAFSAEIQARAGETLQAGLRPNPNLELEVENIAGSGEFSGTDAAETTLMLSQAIELGGKRDHRRRAAAAATELARGEQAIARAEVRARTTQRFVAVLAAQERLRLAKELAALARQALATVEERIEAGKAPATEKIRSRILVAELVLAQNQTAHELVAARQRLAAQLGLDGSVGAVSGDLGRLPHLPAVTELEEILARSPQAARWAAATAARDEQLALERAQAIPDLEVGVGARYFNDSEESALVVGVSIPLPVFDRNQGAVAAARSRLAKSRAESRQADLQARAALAGAWQEMSAAREEAEALRDDIVPAAEEAFAAAEYGYRAGKFSLLDVLDAQKTLIEARQSHLTALARFHQAVAALEGLLGLPFSSITLDSHPAKENTPS